MNLLESELPSSIEGFDLGEIGFEKIKNYPCVPLFVKSLYTIMFWVTLRQFMQERMEEKHTTALADMVAPLQVTVGTATGKFINSIKEERLFTQVFKYSS